MSDFGMCRSLIEAAKGAEPDGGFVTDHLDAAEVWLDKIEETVKAQAAEIEKLREALLDALSHCYNCSGDPHYIEEDEVTGDHLWTDCPICRSARAALGETK